MIHNYPYTSRKQRRENEERKTGTRESKTKHHYVVESEKLNRERVLEVRMVMEHVRKARDESKKKRRMISYNSAFMR